MSLSCPIYLHCLPCLPYLSTLPTYATLTLPTSTTQPHSSARSLADLLATNRFPTKRDLCPVTISLVCIRAHSLTLHLHFPSNRIRSFSLSTRHVDPLHSTSHRHHITPSWQTTPLPPRKHPLIILTMDRTRTTFPCSPSPNVTSVKTVTPLLSSLADWTSIRNSGRRAWVSRAMIGGERCVGRRAVVPRSRLVD
jgi:hypothetical protein